MDASAGLRAHKPGSIGAPLSAGRRNFGYVPSQHLGTAIAPGLSITDNALIGHQRHPPFGVLINPAAKAGWADRIRNRFSTAGEAEDLAATLSGGNLQRLTLGRELAHGGPLIVASYPARGLDIASAAAIRSALVDAADVGKGVLIASEEIEETLEIATRVLVMHRGRIVADMPPEELDSRKLGALMTLGRAA